MLWLAQLHGYNGLRTIINDYASRPQLRFWLKSALVLGTVLIVSSGTLVIFTFDPCWIRRPPSLSAGELT